MSKLRMLAAYVAWGIVGVISAYLLALLGLFNILAVPMALILLVKDLIEEFAVRMGFEEPEWWSAFEHLPVSTTWGVISWIHGLTPAALLFWVDVVLDLFQDVRFRRSSARSSP